MSGAQIGFHGKLPSHGDFLQRRVSEPFLNAWDPWLQHCMVASRERLGTHWLQIYLTSPIWRFVLSEGIAGAASYVGVLMPSVDKVGRYFPFTITAELPADLQPMAAAIHGRAWFRRIEALALAALDAQDFDLERFDAALLASSEDLGFAERRATVALDAAFPQGSFHWRVPIESSERVAAALIDPLMAGVSRALRPMSLWWTEGSEHVGASCLLVRALPEPQRYSAMLDGSWADANWAGEHADLVREVAEPFRYHVASGGITDVGPVRKVNEDAQCDRADLGLWAVADGMGGHRHGAEASQMVVDAIGSLQPTATVSAALSEARVALERVNSDIHRSALRAAGPEQSGSTVVLLCIRQAEWGVLWAGDSRVYLLRQGVFSALTRDHAESFVAATEEASANAAPAAASGVITRAVGGHETLVLDQASGPLMAGDRFLLCSDGVHSVLSSGQLAEILGAFADAGEAARQVVTAAMGVPTRDNVTALVVDVIAEGTAEAR